MGRKPTNTSRNFGKRWPRIQVGGREPRIQRQEPPSEIPVEDLLPREDLIPKAWHSEISYATRIAVVAMIIVILHNKRPDAPMPFKRRLPRVARRMEKYCYLKAKTFEEYYNIETLPTRMERFAMLLLVYARRPGRHPEQNRIRASSFGGKHQGSDS